MACNGGSRGWDDMIWQEMIAPVVVGFSLSLIVCVALVVTQNLHGHFTHDDQTGVQKFHHKPTPRIGGAAIAVAYALVWPVIPAEIQGMWAMIGIAGIPALVAGLSEDLTRQVGVRTRLLATMFSGLILAILTGYTMHKVDLPGVDWLLGFFPVALVFTAFAIGGVANSINIIDGFNGLAAGTLLIMFSTFAAIAWLVDDTLIFSLAIVFSALILGFFVVNFPLGRIFLGDGGAYFCGFLLATLGVLLPMRNPEISAWTAILICGYPVIETLASMWRKSRREGHSVGRPDGVHFHMLAYRRYARRIVKKGASNRHLRNPVTSVVTWFLPLLTAVLAVISYDNTWLSAVFFFLTVVVYDEVYRVMSLNSTRLPTSLARLL